MWHNVIELYINNIYNKEETTWCKLRNNFCSLSEPQLPVTKLSVWFLVFLAFSPLCFSMTPSKSFVRRIHAAQPSCCCTLSSFLLIWHKLRQIFCKQLLTPGRKFSFLLFHDLLGCTITSLPVLVQAKSIMEELRRINLTYITERIITIFCGPECVEETYLHNLQELVVMLQAKHGHNYMVGWRIFNMDE